MTTLVVEGAAASFERERSIAIRATDQALSTRSANDHAKAACAWSKAAHSALCAGLERERQRALQIAKRHDEALAATT